MAFDHKCMHAGLFRQTNHYVRVKGDSLTVTVVWIINVGQDCKKALLVTSCELNNAQVLQALHLGVLLLTQVDPRLLWKCDVIKELHRVHLDVSYPRAELSCRVSFAERVSHTSS